MICRDLLRLALFPWLASVPVHAERINWFCDPNQVNLDASGQPMDAGFAFELGVFADGFVPTAANTGDWEAHWHAAQATAYVPATAVFTASFEVTGNPSPFSVGTRGWIFGRKEQSGVREWILFRGSHWTWPSPNPANPFPVLWSVDHASEVPLGVVNPSGAPFLMQAVSVDGGPGLLDYETWKAGALAGEPLDGPDDDPDRDGTSNIFEFVFDGDPLVPQAPVDLSPVLVGGRLQVEVPRLASRNAVLMVEVSSDLAGWLAGPDHVEIIADEPLRLVARDRTPINTAADGRRFIRVRAVLP